MRSFRTLTISTLIAVYVLILVGGIVRSTGSGMGCPDWPKCFGSWVPPASESELPTNYKEIYSKYRSDKNEKFARYLRLIGFEETADKLLSDKSILQEADFNPLKTRIEYFNRIVGVIIGILIFAVAVSSLRFRQTHGRITILAVVTFLLVGFQGWLGSFVVSSNLTPWTVTVHMFLAMVIVGLLVYMIEATGYNETFVNPLAFWWLIACIGVTLVQILLGTRLREAVDIVAASTSRDSWLEVIGRPFIIHRTFSWAVLITHIGLVFNLRKTTRLRIFSVALILLILSAILTGVGMAWYGIPAFLQPIHLLLATICFGTQFMLLLRLKGNVQTALTN